MSDDDAVEKGTREEAVREEDILQMLTGLYTNMTPSEVRPSPLFHVNRRVGFSRWQFLPTVRGRVQN